MTKAYPSAERRNGRWMPNGNMKGTITSNRRWRCARAPSGRVRSMKWETKRDLRRIANMSPKGSRIKLQRLDGWASSEGPLTASFEVSVPFLWFVGGENACWCLPISSRQGKMDALHTSEAQIPVYFPMRRGIG